MIVLMGNQFILLFGDNFNNKKREDVSIFQIWQARTQNLREGQTSHSGNTSRISYTTSCGKLM